MPLHFAIQNELRPMLRCEAESNPGFKQVIPYVILEHRPTGRVYMTMRLGGDSRLVGQASIGLGGHIDFGEDVSKCLYRELKEEVGIIPEYIVDITFCGFLHSEATEVDSVHVGMVYLAYTDRDDIACIEKDKLSGTWITKNELHRLKMNGFLESWSELVVDHVLRKEDA